MICGFSLQLPNNFEAQVRPSQDCTKKLNYSFKQPGTIDSDYRGEVGVILINHSENNFEIIRGMRIAQIVFIELPKIEIVESQSLSKTVRGKGGFRSTGLNK